MKDAKEEEDLSFYYIDVLNLFCQSTKSPSTPAVISE